MTEGELSTALAVLRVVRGWTQEDLADASGVRASALSDYERGRKTPEFKTLQRVIGAMGYPLSAVDRAQSFVYSLRADPAQADRERGKGDSRPLDDVLESTEAFRWEIEAASAEAGRVVSRLARLMLILLSRPELDANGSDGRQPS
jgi:transcriptional regulator with XRE-family HTH domain